MSLFARAQKKKKKKSKSVSVSALREKLEASSTPGAPEATPAPSLQKSSGWLDGEDEEPTVLNFTGKTVTTEKEGPREEEYEVGDHRKRDEASAALREARIKQAKLIKAAESEADGTAPAPKPAEPAKKGVWRPRVSRMPLQKSKKSASIQSEEDFPTLGGPKKGGTSGSGASTAWGTIDVPDELEPVPEPEPEPAEPAEEEPAEPERCFDNELVGFEGEPMTEAQLKAEGASMAREFESVKDVKELVLRANDARADAEGRGLMVRVLIENSLEWRDEDALKALSEGLLAMLEAGTLKPQNMVKAVEEVMEFFDDIMIDAPRADSSAALSLRGLVDFNIVDPATMNAKVVKKMGLEPAAAPAEDTAAVPAPEAAVPPPAGGGGGGAGEPAAAPAAEEPASEAPVAEAPAPAPEAEAAVEEELADLYSKKKKKKKKPKA